MATTESFQVNFPTLADVLDPWYRAHCSIPDGFNIGDPFVMADWQFWCTANHYRIRKSAKWQPRKPMLNQAFAYRRSQIVGPQKSGKGLIRSSPNSPRKLWDCQSKRLNSAFPIPGHQATPGVSPLPE